MGRSKMRISFVLLLSGIVFGLAFQNCSNSSFSGPKGPDDGTTVDTTASSTNPATTAPDSPALSLVAAVSCAGLTALSALSGGSSFSCQHCTSYYEFNDPQQGVMPFTGCVHALPPDLQGTAVIQALIAARDGSGLPAGYSWTSWFSCQPVAESECDLPEGRVYEFTFPAGVLRPSGPYDPNHLPDGLKLLSK